jgi:hypothetical protein
MSSKNQKKCYYMHNLCVAKDFLDLEGFESCKEFHMAENQ